jgi:antitoxin component of RelBE/YafQ-DinJ toxin-antitoxin module
MNKTEVLTIRIEEELGQRLSGIASEIGMTRADYLRMVLRLASSVDSKELLKAWDAGLKQQMLHQ